MDDPYLFGQIAAANALSDVYAMGGTPASAMNLLCVPSCLSLDTVRGILQGGHEKAMEAKCIIAGGHTIEDDVPKYGLCVTGFVHPQKILKNVGAKQGDILILTKPIGTGILNTGAKAQLTQKADFDRAVSTMAALNASAAAQLAAVGEIHACTDVTGFGLMGHSYEMASGSNVTLRLHSDKIPFLNGALKLAQDGIIPGGAHRNAEYVKPYVQIKDHVSQAIADLIADPQTSGGLLAAVPEGKVKELVTRLEDAGCLGAVIGEVDAFGGHSLVID